jgi:hypothetical protein
MPVRDLIVKLYQAPGEVEDLVSRRRGVLTGEKPWVALAGDSARNEPFLDQVKGEDFFIHRTSGTGRPTSGRVRSGFRRSRSLWGQELS